MNSTPTNKTILSNNSQKWRPRIMKYYSLNAYGDIEYIGEFTTFDEADESVKDSFFIADQDTIKNWKKQIDKHLEA